MKAATVWMTGLPCAGKTTLARALAEALRTSGAAVVVLDGDEVRRTLSADLGFDAASRDENVRRVAAVATHITGSGVFAVVALVSPHRLAREQARAAHAARGLPFLEVHLDEPLERCEARDPRGLYARARAGLTRDVTGLDAPYEAPAAAEVRLSGLTVEEGVARVLAALPR